MLAEKNTAESFELAAPEANFVLYPQLTPVQDRAFQLLDLGVKV